MNLTRGQKVKVVSGRYRGLEGKVFEPHYTPYGEMVRVVPVKTAQGEELSLAEQNAWTLVFCESSLEKI